MSNIYNFSIDIIFDGKTKEERYRIMRTIERVVTDICEDECLEAIDDKFWSKSEA